MREFLRQYTRPRAAGVHVRFGMIAAAGLLCIVLSGCEEPPPITFEEFMEDDIARDGTLARCNQSREATLNDIECANARRAASTVALRDERRRREELEIDSARKIEELRDRIARQEEAFREAQVAAEAAARAAYEQQWQLLRGGAEAGAGSSDSSPAEGLAPASGDTAR
jgi:hypothetical protein